MGEERCLDCNADCGDCPTANLPYFEDFSGAVGPEWSRKRIGCTPSGEWFLGDFLNQSAALDLDGFQVGMTITLTFDLFIIRSWDGNDDFHGPDFFNVTINGVEFLNTTFASHIAEQSYPDDYLASHPCRTGALYDNTLGYGYGERGDSVYRIEWTFETTDEHLAIVWSASNLQYLDDESWGLDNVRITQ